MTATRVKFYQTGSFAVGNRLLPLADRSVQATTDRTNALTSGHRACQGCGEALGARYVLDAAARATDGHLVVVNATGCLEVFSTPYPESSWRLPWLHSLFGNAPAVASGVAAALRAQGRTDIRVVGQGGDGGTVDIGFACLSGMFERNDDVLFICYDNEAYANTGIQTSPTTPYGGNTTFTPPGPAIPEGKTLFPKDPPQLVIGGHPAVKYVATASVGYPVDLINKVRKALNVVGPTFMHIHCPCPKGWGFDEAKTVEVAKLAIETGMWNMYEWENGEYRYQFRPKKYRPVREYLKMQQRFAHLTDAHIARLQAFVDAKVKSKAVPVEAPVPTPQAH
jgi:pyruvate ferredoxin oxidoreductase beta subunit